MGSATSSGGGQDENSLGELFSLEEVLSEKRQDNLPLSTEALSQMRPDTAPAQTDAKSRLIASYLSKFQLITKGGVYIDGFAAPQKRSHPSAWTARRVLEIDPPRLRTLWLCDNDPGGIAQLRALKAKHHGKPRSRRVFVFEGDFNQTVEMVLKSGRIRPRTAVFALLDQRNTECHWSTVKALASYKGRTRVELLYFLGIGWLHRSLSASHRPERLKEIDRWWGSNSWQGLRDLSQVEIELLMASRFQKELGYRYANYWPVYLKEDGIKKAFTLIHATDHPEAPKLMRRAYQEIYGAKSGSPTDAQLSMFKPELDC